MVKLVDELFSKNCVSHFTFIFFPPFLGSQRRTRNCDECTRVRRFAIKEPNLIVLYARKCFLILANTVIAERIFEKF